MKQSNEISREWQPVRVHSTGLFPETDRFWCCNPAWDITAVYPEVDKTVSYPADADSDDIVRTEFFVNRHIDRRFHIEYNLAEPNRPRTSTPTVADSGKEWDIVIEHRDRYLKEAGLTLASHPAKIAKCLADSFLCDNHFKDKPMCTYYPDNPRALVHPIDGLRYKSFCVGCATAFNALAQSCGLFARNLGVGAHWVAEVLIDGKWCFVENTGRHEKNRGLGAFFNYSHMVMSSNPAMDFGVPVPEDYRKSLLKRVNPQYHNFILGTWQDPATLRFSSSCAYALYPDADNWTIKAEAGCRLPLVRNAGGFYYPAIHASFAKEKIREIRSKACPEPLHDFDPKLNFRDYLYHPFEPGEKIRQSIWLDTSLSEIERIELVLTFGASRVSDFSKSTGDKLLLSVGNTTMPLTDIATWPPHDSGGGAPLQVKLSLKPQLFKADSVNWLVLENCSDSLFHLPFVPNAMEPYISPLQRL